MRILSMTATFGKLEHATLTLEPGLNIIHAPNEWGKSTWCAFLINMLYGIDSRARSTGTVLTDKAHYTPWSGAPMSGRIDLEWNGKRITIERRSTSRIPFGDFQAYETDTGIEVPQLNAANCGQQLLGVERSVFARAGFLRLNDLPVTQDEALRRRLNNLVTTGDESGDGDKLKQTLKDLKNKCRFNQSGLLPQAEKERDQLRYRLQQLQQLQADTQAIRQQQSELEDKIDQLQRHSQVLQYEASVQAAQQVTAAEDAAAQAQLLTQQLTAQCAQLPSAQQLRQELSQLDSLSQQQQQLSLEQKMLPPAPQPPSSTAIQGDPQQAVALAQEDLAAYRQLDAEKAKRAKQMPLRYIAAAAAPVLLTVLGAVALGKIWIYPVGGALLALAMILLYMTDRKRADRLQQQLQQLYDRHPGVTPDHWLSNAQQYAQQHQVYAQQAQQYQQQLQALQQKQQSLDRQIQTMTQGQDPGDFRQTLEAALDIHSQLESALQAHAQTQQHAQALRAVAKTVPKPQGAADTLTLDAQQTQQALSQAQLSLHQLQLRLGQCLGQAEALGEERLLRSRLDMLNRRIARLEDTYQALELAQNALYQATTALQRRFAPRISQLAQEYFSTLTDGRYQRIILAEDLSLQTGAENEDNVYAARYRSDGTVDQLYLALRLAVARELTPQAPLVLDDALVRFDDQRLKRAMALLRQAADEKQVILFTCQGRESGL